MKTKNIGILEGFIIPNFEIYESDENEFDYKYLGLKTCCSFLTMGNWIVLDR